MFSMDSKEEQEEDEDGLKKLLDEWHSLEKSMDIIQNNFNAYADQRSQVNSKEQGCISSINGHLKKLTDFRQRIDNLFQNSRNPHILALKLDIDERCTRLYDMKDQLPRDGTSFYLSIILGDVDVSLKSKEAKFNYKRKYETFKIRCTLVSLFLTAVAFVFSFRVADAFLQFFLVWFYCTLTIRESILIANGSRIKGWWLAHHYISTALCGILVTWPNGPSYLAFRRQFQLFTFYISLIQLLQCQYQKGCLRRLHALGQGHSMDVTVEGFHSWMFKGLTFLLPFLFIGYAWQLFNAYTLILVFLYEPSSEWQVLVLALLFLLVAVGNTATASQVCLKKISERDNVPMRKRLQSKYSIANLNVPLSSLKKSD